MDIRDALLELAAFDPSLQEAVEDSEANFGDDLPFVSFGALGRAVVDNFEVLDTETRKRFFNRAEELLTSSPEQTQNAIATALLEAIVNRAESSSIGQEAVHEYMGQESRTYIAAWNEFHGVSEDE